MHYVDPVTASILWHDADDRESRLRQIIAERLAVSPPPSIPDAVVASYFFAFRSLKLVDAVEEISYHATSGVKQPPKGSLLEACSAKAAGVDAFDATGRLGLVHVAFPLKMLQHPDGHITSCDLLHTTAAAIIFDVYENQDARLVSLRLPESVLRSFPGPAFGPAGIRALTGFPAKSPGFGTILKPTAGITPAEVEGMVEQVAGCQLLLFVKEDEDLYPDLAYSPVGERTRRAVAAIERRREERGGLGLIFAPHITGAPHEILETLHEVLDAGATAVMLSETFAGGAVRMIREATKHLSCPPAIYGHNAGIGTRTRGIWREVIDFLARLDGIDFRQTSVVRPGAPFLRPYGQEWRASEAALTTPLPGIRPTMIVRAGGLDQGNIGLNLADAEHRGLLEGVLFLAGSAINSVKDSSGKINPALGTEAMTQAIDVYSSGALNGVGANEYLPALRALAERKHLGALSEALRQRYGSL